MSKVLNININIDMGRLKDFPQEIRVVIENDPHLTEYESFVQINKVMKNDTMNMKFKYNDSNVNTINVTNNFNYINQGGFSKNAEKGVKN